MWQRGVAHVLSINQIFSIVVLNSATFNWKGGTTSTAVELHYNQDLSWSWLFQKRKSLFVMDLQGVSQRHSVFCIYFPSYNTLNFYQIGRKAFLNRKKVWNGQRGWTFSTCCMSSYLRGNPYRLPFPNWYSTSKYSPLFPHKFSSQRRSLSPNILSHFFALALPLDSTIGTYM